MFTDSKSSGFAYTALKPGEIRLLNPVAPDTGHNWEIQVVDLNTVDLTFEALSYTWGPQAETFPISCNGGVMQIHYNLYSALPFLARRTGEITSRPIWIDAVCINQVDDEEKLIQIRLMNTIYRCAKKVWVWLGLAAAEVQEQIPYAATLLPHIVEERMRQKDLPRDPEAGEVAVPLRNLELSVWKAMLHLLRNSYYQRVWVVQEGALARDIAFLCGKHEIDFAMLEAAIDNDFVHMWKIYDAHGDQVRFPIPISDSSTLFHIRECVRHDATTLNAVTPSLLLRVAILMSREHDCFHAHDRVFGTLGLVKEEDLETTGINIRTCTTLQDLYTQFSTYLLLNNDPNMAENWWKYFNSAFTFNKPEGLPSWVPDLHHQRQFVAEYVCEPRWIVQFIQRWPLYQRYQASWKPTVIRQGSQVGEIILRGKILDEISLTHPTPPNTPDASSDSDGRGAMSFLIQLADWEKDVADTVLWNIDQNHAWRISEETYWRTLLADNLSDSVTGSAIDGEQWRIFHDTMSKVKKLAQRVLESVANGHGDAELTKEDPAAFSSIKKGTPTYSFTCALQLLKNRQLFNTAQRRFGFTIKGVQPGDLVCVFNTASTPHVLRKVKDQEGEVYQVIGDAYVHGLMNAQADDIEVEERDIILV